MINGAVKRLAVANKLDWIESSVVDLFWLLGTVLSAGNKQINA